MSPILFGWVDYEKLFVGLTWLDKWLSNPIFIWLDEFHKWSLKITCLNSFKFGQIIIDDYNPRKWHHTAHIVKLSTFNITYHSMSLSAAQIWGQLKNLEVLGFLGKLVRLAKRVPDTTR